MAGEQARRGWDLKVMCSIWQEQEFTALTTTAQWAVFRSVGQLGIDRSMGGMRYRAADIDMDPFVFEMVARELVQIGVWTWVDDDVVEVWPYRDLVIPFKVSYRTPIASEIRRMVFDRDGNACRHCGETEHLEIDHIYPWSKGGSDHSDNLQTLCRSCNYRKGARVPV